MKFAVRITKSDNQGYEQKICCEATVDAWNASKALVKVFNEFDIQDAPAEVEECFEFTGNEYHGMTGNYSYDVCPA